MVYHSVVLERPPLPLQPFAQTVTLHVRLFPLQWHLKVPGNARGYRGEENVFSGADDLCEANSGAYIRVEKRKSNLS